MNFLYENRITKHIALLLKINFVYMVMLQLWIFFSIPIIKHVGDTRRWIVRLCYSLNKGIDIFHSNCNLSRIFWTSNVEQMFCNPNIWTLASEKWIKECDRHIPLVRLVIIDWMTYCVTLIDILKNTLTPYLQYIYIYFIPWISSPNKLND